MADDEQFSLCWNNFNTNLSAGFHESLCRGDLVDVTLAAEGQLVKAHRLVLSVCSPYFRKMFTQMPANQHAFVFLKDVSHSALKDLIQFMYCGEVNVKQEALPAFISTAEALQIKGLTDSDPPASQTPPEPSTPTQQTQQVASPRMSQQRQRTSTSRSYKIETVEDTVEDKTPSTQIVIQTTSAAPPIATIVHHQPTPQLQHHHQSPQIQTVSSVAPSTVATTSAATLVQSSSKRSAQRSSVGSTGPHTKRTKSTIDPLESAETATTTANTQIQPQQITVQSAVVTTDNSKIQQARQQTSAETEYIDLPTIELPTKSEPEYTEDTGEVVTGDQDTSYVEDDAYGDMRYDESYFTENEDGAPAVSAANASGTVAASTSKALIKQQTSQSFSDSSYVDPADGANSEAQVVLANDVVPNPDDVLILFTQSLRGRPAIMANGIRFLIMSENKKKILWRCSSMATKKIKCPARITMLKETPPKFIINKAEHIHAELKRNKYGSSKMQPLAQIMGVTQIKAGEAVEIDGAVNFELLDDTELHHHHTHLHAEELHVTTVATTSTATSTQQQLSLV